MSAAGGSSSADNTGSGTGGGVEGVPWPTGADGYKLDKIIGKGAFATVWKAFCETRGVHVAVKVMDLENVTHSFEDIRQEVCALVTHFERLRRFRLASKSRSLEKCGYASLYCLCG